MNKTAIIIGATGLVGKQLTQQLILDDDYSQVIIFVRRKLILEPTAKTNSISSSTSEHKLTQHIVDFDNLPTWHSLIVGDDLFCCLGTTAKLAGSKVKQTEIDLLLPTNIAKIAANNGIQQMLLVSSTGANVDSTSFYLKLKGQLEQNLMALNFNKLVIVRPSFLTGQRDEFRFGERLGIGLFIILRYIPVIRNYRPITGYQLACKLRSLAKTKDGSKVVIKELEQLFK